MKPQAFSVVIADPPWLFGDALPGKGRGASRQYHCLDVAALCTFRLPPIADSALLLLWRVASMQREAINVAEAWGFTVKSEIVWHKLTKHGKPWFGMGHYVRASHETCLIATRGRFKAATRSERSIFEAPSYDFEAPVPVDNGRYIHSAKPPVFHEIAERLAGCKGVELFARRRTPGWVCLRNELPPE